MTDEELNKIRGVVKGEIKDALEPLAEDLKDVSSELADLMVEVKGKVIPKLENLEKTVKSIEVSVRRDGDNIERLDKRVTNAESQLGIQAPPEHQIIK